MTEDFKSKIIAYLCGKYEVQTGENKPTIEEIKETTNNFTDNLKAELKNQGHEVYRLYIYGSVQSRNASDEGLDKTLIYGVVDDINRDLTGYIAIVDVNFNLIQVITKYSSGVNIDRLQNLEVDEKGNLMAIERHGAGVGTLRFLLLNNPTVKLPSDTEYKLIIKKSYEFPSNLNNYNYNFIRRRISGGNYLFGGTNTTSTGRLPIAVELTINVGTDNDWKLFESDSSFDSSVSYSVIDIWQNWDSQNNFDFQMIGFAGTEKGKLCVFSKEDTTISLNTINMFLPVSNETIKKSSAKIQQKNDFYSIIYSIYNNNRNSRFQIFHIYDNLSDRIYSQKINLTNYSPNDDYSYFDIKIYGYDVNIVALCTKTTSTYILYIGRIANNQVYLVEKDNINQPIPNPIVFYNVTKQFNLYNYQFQLWNKLYSTLEIYNESNYNGFPYQNLDSMVPNSGILYNSSNIPIFARNLYNKTISARTTQSTIEVPNTYLNDDIISKEKLLGKTNSILISNNQAITKNIYETLNINFINALQIRNDNDETNSILNPIGASRLNNSISNLADYENAKMSKYRINYSDNTNRIINNIWAPIGNFYRTIINIYVNKEIKSIDFISDDETTIYCSIRPILEINKIYKIKQDVYIDEKIQPNEVFYGVDEVFYNDEKVYY